MSNSRASALAIILLAASLSIASTRSGPSDPEAVALLEKAVHALEGPEAYRRSADARIEMKAVSPSSGDGIPVELELVLYTRSDGKRRLEKRIQGEVQIYGYDGKDAWMTLAGNQIVSMPPAQAAAVRIESRLPLILIDHEKQGYVARREQSTTDEGRSLESVVLQKSAGTLVLTTQAHLCLSLKLSRWSLP